MILRQKKNSNNFSENRYQLLCDGQAVRVFSEVGTGFLCYLDEYHIQRLLLNI